MCNPPPARLDNEQMLMVMYGVDDEELEGCDIAPQTRSHFLDLMSSGVFLTLAGGSNCNAVNIGVQRTKLFWTSS